MKQISKLENTEVKEENKIFNKVEQLKREDKNFARLVTQIEVKLTMLIDFTNSKKSYRPNYSSPKVNIIVDAIKMTTEEFDCLEKFLYEKYIDKVHGDYFCIKKKFLSNKYKIYTKKRSYCDYLD